MRAVPPVVAPSRTRAGAVARGFVLLAAAVSLAVTGLAMIELAIPGTRAEAAARWGWLGVRIRDLSEQEMNDISKRHGLREGFGVMIVEVMKETPAEVSGLRKDDLVVAFRDRPVVDTRSLQRLISRAAVGETVQITVLRGNEGRRGVAVQLAPMPEPVAAERVASEFGFIVREPDASIESGARRLSSAPAVAAVFPGSRADIAGLKVGDVLLEVNGRPVVTLDAVRAALIEVRLERPLPLTIRRDDTRLPLVVPPPEADQAR